MRSRPREPPTAPKGGPVELTIANLFYAATQLLLILVLTRLTSVVEVGRFAYALAITGPIHLAIGLRLRSVRVVDEAPSPLSAYLLVASGAGLLSVVLATAASALIVDDLGTLAVVTVVSLSKMVEGLVDVHYGELQRVGEIRRLAWTQVGRAVTGLLGFTLGVVLTGAALGGALGLSVAWSLLLMCNLGSHGIPCRTQFADVRRIVRIAWPLGAASGLNSLNTNSSRLVAEGLLGTYATGIIAIMAYPGAIISIISNSMGQAVLGSLRDAYARGRTSAVRRMSVYIVTAPLAMGVTMIIAASKWGEELLRYGFGSEYSKYSLELILMLVAATVASMSTSVYYLLLARGIRARQLWVALGTTLLGIPILVTLTVLERDLTNLALGALGVSIVQFLAYLLASGFKTASDENGRV